MQKEIRCPYCELKKMAKQKMVFRATNPIDGECPECGALIDAGQHEVKINDLVSICEGAEALLDYVVEQFNRLLKEEGIELTGHLPNGEEGTKLRLNTSFLIEYLLATWYGDTTQRNIKKALGIKKEYLAWKISKDEAEEW